MIVALRALNRQTKDAFANAIHAIKHGIHAKLLRIDAALLVNHRISQKTGRYDLVLARIWKLITGDLVDNKLIVRHVAVQRVDYPVAVKPNAARLVLFETVGIGIARGVQPLPRPTLAVMRRGQEAFNLLLVSIGATICHKGIDFRWRGRQSN